MLFCDFSRVFSQFSTVKVHFPWLSNAFHWTAVWNCAKKCRKCVKACLFVLAESPDNLSVFWKVSGSFPAGCLWCDKFQVWIPQVSMCLCRVLSFKRTHWSRIGETYLGSFPIYVNLYHAASAAISWWNPIPLTLHASTMSVRCALVEGRT